VPGELADNVVLREERAVLRTLSGHSADVSAL